jgi:hypothetical protein
LPKGERDNMLFREACRLRGKNMTEQEAWIILSAFAAQCNPPFAEKDALDKLKQAWKYPVEVSDYVDIEGVEPEDCDDGESECLHQDFLQPGGVLQGIMEHIERNSAVSFPLFSLAAAITALGSVIGQKVMTETGLRTNIYSIALGYSGSGKNSPLGTIPQLLARTDANCILGMNTLTSGVAILARLVAQPVSLMMVDETGLLLHGLKNPNSPAVDAPRVFTELFSATNRPYDKGYADSKRDIKILYHHLSFYGVSVPGPFWESLSEGDALNGFLSRWLIWQSDHPAEKPKANLVFSTSKELIASINDLFNIKVEMNKSTGNNPQFHTPIPNIIPKTNEALDVFQPWADQYHNLKNQYREENGGASSIYSRAAEHAHKLALVHAMSIGGSATRNVGVDSVRWACAIIDHLIKMTLIQLPNVCDDETTRLKQRVLLWIRNKMKDKGRPYNGVSMAEIIRGPLQKYGSKKQADQFIETMLVSGQLGQTTHKPTRGPEKAIYFAAKRKSTQYA